MHYSDFGVTQKLREVIRSIYTKFTIVGEIPSVRR